MVGVEDVLVRFVRAVMPDYQTRAVVETYFRGRRPQRQVLADVLGRDAIGVVLESSPAVRRDADRAQDARVVGYIRERQKARPVVGEEVDRSLAGGLVDTAVRLLVAPLACRGIQLVQRSERATQEKVRADVLDRSLHATLFPPRSPVARNRLVEEVAGEVHEARIPPDVGPVVGEDRAAKVVVEAFSGATTEEGEGILMAAKKFLHALGESELQIDHPAEREDHDKRGHAPLPAADLDRAAVRPVHLGRLAGVEESAHVGLVLPLCPDLHQSILHDADLALETAALQLLKHPNRGDPGGLGEKLLHVHLEGIEDRRTLPSRAGRRVIVLEGTPDRTPVDLEGACDLTLGKLLHVIEPADLGPSLGSHRAPPGGTPSTW